MRERLERRGGKESRTGERERTNEGKVGEINE